MKSLERLLVMAEKLYESNDLEGLKKIDAWLSSYIRKHAHMVPSNNGKTPNPWRKNMDYAGWENSPYFGSIGDFMKKFPGGIKDWVEWRRKEEKNRNKKWDIKERKAHLLNLMKNAEEKTFDDLSRSIYHMSIDDLSDLKEKIEKILEDNKKALNPKPIPEDYITPEEDFNFADDKNDLREKLADLEHEQWAHWTKYMLDRIDDEEEISKWRKQCDTEYKDLSEKEKDSDREWADKVLDIFSEKGIEIKAHFEPDTVDFVKLTPPKEWTDVVKDFIKCRENKEQNAEDVVKDFINYWKLLHNAKKRRGGK